MERLHDVVDQIHIGRIIKIVDAQQFLDADVALFRERGGFGFFFDRIVMLGLELRDDRVNTVIEISGLIGRPGDNQRRPCFIDQNAIDLVHDCEVQVALYALVQVGDDQIIAEIIESVFVVRPVGNVGAIGFGPGAGTQMLEPLVGGVVGRVEDKRGVVLNDSCRQPQRMIELAHPLRVAFGQVVVDRDQMGSLAFQGVQINRQRGHEGLPFTRLHFRNAALVQDHAADQLHVEVPHVQLPAGHFPADGKGLGEDVIDGFSVGQPFLERLGLVRQGLIGEGSQSGFQAVDALDERHQGLDFTVILAAEDQIEYLRQHTFTNGISGRCFDLIFAVYRKYFPNPIVKTQTCKD